MKNLINIMLKITLKNQAKQYYLTIPIPERGIVKKNIIHSDRRMNQQATAIP